MKAPDGTVTMVAAEAGEGLLQAALAVLGSPTAVSTGEAAAPKG